MTGLLKSVKYLDAYFSRDSKGLFRSNWFASRADVFRSTIQNHLKVQDLSFNCYKFDGK